MSDTRLYNIWEAVKNRCYNPKSANYYRYGGRGIKVCDAWKKSFSTFAKWANSNGYAPHLSIDRVNNNKGYYPNNCRWVTQRIQNWNRTRTKLSVQKAWEIRDLYTTGKFTQIQLSNKYGVDRRAIGDVIAFKIWDYPRPDNQL